MCITNYPKLLIAACLTIVLFTSCVPNKNTFYGPKTSICPDDPMGFSIHLKASKNYTIKVVDQNDLVYRDLQTEINRKFKNIMQKARNSNKTYASGQFFVSAPAPHDMLHSTSFKITLASIGGKEQVIETLNLKRGHPLNNMGDFIVEGNEFTCTKGYIEPLLFMFQNYESNGDLTPISKNYGDKKITRITNNFPITIKFEYGIGESLNDPNVQKRVINLMSNESLDISAETDNSITRYPYLIYGLKVSPTSPLACSNTNTASFTVEFSCD